MEKDRSARSSGGDRGRALPPFAHLTPGQPAKRVDALSPEAHEPDLASRCSQADQEWGIELERLEGASSSNPFEALDWCKRAIDYLKRDVARRGSNWSAESASALRLTFAAIKQAIALEADPAVLSSLQ